MGDGSYGIKSHESVEKDTGGGSSEEPVYIPVSCKGQKAMLDSERGTACDTCKGSGECCDGGMDVVRLLYAP